MLDARRAFKKEAFMQIAETLALLGTCDRKEVGCVIIRDGRCISWGFNGAPSGLPHCAENNHGWPDWHEGEPNPAVYGGCRNATHAEANALAAAAKQGISTDGGTLYTTVSPCDTCSRLIIAAGVIHVYYREEYRDRSGIDLLLAAGITAEHLA